MKTEKVQLCFALNRRRPSWSDDPKQGQDRIATEILLLQKQMTHRILVVKLLVGPEMLDECFEVSFKFGFLYDLQRARKSLSSVVVFFCFVFVGFCSFSHLHTNFQKFLMEITSSILLLMRFISCSPFSCTSSGVISVSRCHVKHSL